MTLDEHANFSALTPLSGDDATQSLYLRGSFNQWGLSLPFTQISAGHWQLNWTQALGDFEYKIGNADWSFNLGAPFNTQGFTSSNSQNSQLQLSTTQQVQLDLFGYVDSQAQTYWLPIFNYTDVDTDIGFLTQPLYVRGANDDWETLNESNQLSYLGEQVYQIEVTLGAQLHYIKLASADWQQEYGYTATTPFSLDTWLNLQSVDGAGNDIQLNISQAGNYRFTLRQGAQGLQLKVTAL